MQIELKYTVNIQLKMENSIQSRLEIQADLENSMIVQLELWSSPIIQSDFEKSTWLVFSAFLIPTGCEVLLQWSSARFCFLVFNQNWRI